MRAPSKGCARQRGPLSLGFWVAVLVDTRIETRSKLWCCGLPRELLIRFLGNCPHGFGSLKRARLAHHYRH